MNRIDSAFQRIKERGEKALIAYVMAGDPTLEDTETYVQELAAAGADVIELGVPFSDPIADGPVIQQAAERALRSGTTLKKNPGHGPVAPEEDPDPARPDGLLQLDLPVRGGGLLPR